MEKNNKQFIMNLNSKSNYNAQNKAINNLGIISEELTNAMKIYSNGNFKVKDGVSSSEKYKCNCRALLKY
ncbi:hypothetical protein [Clostridium sp.]|uniref:hypothetical protein n=1 Tax=Clostridium sp. TaxID=1506 RepID=UPI002FC5DCFE